MGKGLFNDFDIAKETFAEANEVLGFDLQKICFEGSLQKLNQTENMLPAILTVSVAAFRVYMKEIGYKPTFLAGHSLGEYSALTCSGAIAFADAVKLVHKRSLLATQVKGGLMSVINGVSLEEILDICQKQNASGEILALACQNSIDQFVLSGKEEAVVHAEDQIILLNGQATPILMAPPFHSPLMKEVLPQLQEELGTLTFDTFQFPVVANATALPYKGTDQIIDHLSLQLTSTVRWFDTIAFFQANDVDLTIEMGPKAILSDLIGSRTGLTALSFGQKEDRSAIKDRLQIVSNRYAPTIITRSLAIAVATRNRNTDNEQYRLGVEVPYEQLEQLQLELEEKGMEPTEAQMRQALTWLSQIMRTKGTTKEEQLRRFQQILLETGTEEQLSDFPFCKDASIHVG